MSFEDPEGEAILSLIAGLAGMLFVVFAAGTLLEFVGLVAGLVGVTSGVRVLRGMAENKKLAVTGVVTGTIAVALWAIMFIFRLGAAVWNMIF